jgi:hypothetical protein
MSKRDHQACAMFSLVLGLVSLFAWLLPVCGLPISTAGLVLGIAGKESPRRTMATAGIVTCLIGLVAGFINAAIGVYSGFTGQLFQ